MPLQGLDMASVICLDANKMALPEIKRLNQRFLKQQSGRLNRVIEVNVTGAAPSVLFVVPNGIV